MLVAIILLFILIGGIMVQQTAMARTLRDVRAKQEKSGREIDELITTNTELQLRVVTLEEKLEGLEAGAEVTQELLDAANSVVEYAEVLDSKIPDNPTLPPVTEEETALDQNQEVHRAEGG